ncbi:MAG: substrate-specific activator of APC-dependent proteolysis, variant 2 [Marteilia pararefringens]
MVSAIALAPQRSKINALHFSPSPTNPQLAIGGNDTAITTWNALNGHFYNIFTCTKAQEVLELNYTTSLEWIKNSSKLISGHTSGKINLWDINNCTMNLELCQHKAAVLSIKMNPQMNTLASGGYDKLLFFWDINVCKPDFYLQSLCSPISSISPLMECSVAHRGIILCDLTVEVHPHQSRFVSQIQNL